jgi:hypothetical protein
MVDGSDWEGGPDLADEPGSAVGSEWEDGSDSAGRWAPVDGMAPYYFDHRAEIERHIRDGQTLVEAMRQGTPSLVKEKLHGQ